MIENVVASSASRSTQISTGIARLFSDSFIYAVGIAVNQGLRFLVLPLILRNLEPAQLGSFDAARSFLIVASPLVALGMESAVAILYNQFPDDIRRQRVLMSTGLAIVTIVASILLLVGLWGQTSLYQWVMGGNGNPLVLSLTLGLTAFSAITEYTRNLLKWQMRRFVFVSLLIGEAFLSLIIGVGLVVFAQQGIVGWILALFIANLLTLFLALILNYRVWRLPQFGKFARLLVILGFPFALVSAASLLMPTITRQVLVHTIGLASVGIYGVGERVAYMVAIVLSGFSVAWGPFYLARQHDPDAPRLYGRAALAYLTIATWCGLGVVLAAPWLVSFLSGPTYHNAVQIVLPLALLNILSGLDFVAMGGIYIRQKSFLMIPIYLFSSAVALGLALLLVPELQEVGAAWAALGGKIAGLGIALWISQRLFPIRWDVSKLVRLALVFFAALLMGNAVAGAFTAWMIPVLLALTLVYPIALRILGVVDPAPLWRHIEQLYARRT
jgi:O-antigen/teichoic acid export membrane protein